jgi:uncharacterized RDD family membrane protein YckC
LLIRMAAMTYEAVLLFGVVFVVAYAVLAVARWTYPLPPGPRTALQLILFTAVGVYFIYQWTRTGQTLAMKSWHLRLIGPRGEPPSVKAAALRYVLAWHLFLPGAAWIAIAGFRGPLDLLVFAAGFGLFLVPAFFDRERRLLHDRLSATRVIRER